MDFNFKGLNETYEFDFTEGILTDENGNTINVNECTSRTVARIRVNLNPSERKEFDSHLEANGFILAI